MIHMIDPTKIFSTMKQLYDASQTLKDANVKTLVAELNSQMADLRTQIAELKNENYDLKEQFRQQASKVGREARAEFRAGYYFLKDPQPGEDPGPFCRNCIKRGRFVAVSPQPEAFCGNFGNAKCPECKSQFAEPIPPA